METQGDARWNVLLVSSGGGHLDQLRRLESWWARHDRSWVTFDLPWARGLVGERVEFAHHPSTRNLLRNALVAWRVLRRERPDVLVSTGAGAALPFFALGRLMGVRCVFVKVYDRIDSRTLTGRLCRPLANAFCLQWDRQRELYGSGVVVGPVY